LWVDYALPGDARTRRNICDLAAALSDRQFFGATITMVLQEPKINASAMRGIRRF